MANMRLLAAGVACSMLGLSDAAASCATLTGAAWTVDATSAAKCTETAGAVVADAAACAAVTGFGTKYADNCGAVLTAAADDAADAKACTYAANTCAAAGQQWIGDAGQESFSLDSPWSSPKRKTWWTKRLVSTDHRLYFGGRPSVRDVKYLYEQGYDAVYNVLGSAAAATTGTEALASPAEEASTAAAAGLLYGTWTDAVATPWTSAPAIDALVAFIDFALANTDGPIYVHCGSGFTASAALQMYRLRKAAAAGGMTVQGAIDEIAVHGFDISTHADAVAALFREAGTTAAAVTKPTEDGTDEINKYHWMKFLGAFGEVKMFDAGQIHSTHIAAAKAAGIKVVVNMRKAVTFGGKNSQEETNLLNLKSSAKTSTPAVPAGVSAAKCTETAGVTVVADAAACAAVTGSALADATACEAAVTAADAATKACTYAAAVDIPVVARTSSANILQYYPQWVTESTRPTSWVENGIYNFEGQNALEFGDAVGYNADTEKAAWAAAGIDYVHIPIGHGGSGDYSAAKLLENHVAMMGAITTAQAGGGHVLWHCRTGYRTGAFPSALFAVINGQKADAVGARMAKLGYDYAGNLKNLIDDATATLECADCKCDGTAACTGTFKIKPVKIKEATSAAAAIAPCVATLLAVMALWA